MMDRITVARALRQRPDTMRSLAVRNASADPWPQYADGGVSATLYVKTSGTGNTGWTAK